ncbi:MAG TPA: YggT family protein, partial [Chloroflexia bacterium]|nr:YggT family protein [Chloroflexia bacterium]
MDILFTLANSLLTLITLAIIIRAILSWFYPVGKDPWTRLLVDLTDPLMAPVRAILSRILPIPIDFSPIVVILLINLL